MTEKTEKAECIYRKYIKCLLDEKSILHVSFIGIDETFDAKRQKTKPYLPLILMMELQEFFSEMNRFLENNSKDDIKEVYLEGFADANVFAVGAVIDAIKKILETSMDKYTLYRKAMIFSEIGQNALLEIKSCPKKVTAIIDGFALGGGLELAMACHARMVKSINTVFGLPETTLGLIPGWGGTWWWRFIPKLNQEKFIEYMKTGASFNAREALSINLIDSTVDIDEMETPAIVNQSKPYSRSSVAMIKDVIGITNKIDTGTNLALSIERENFAVAMTSPDAMEGITAFLEKRKANFE